MSSLGPFQSEHCKHGMILATCAYCNPRPPVAKPLSRMAPGGPKRPLPDLARDKLEAYVPLARKRLTDLAREQRPIPYSEIMDEFGGRGHIGKVLYEVCKLEHEEGRPLLSAIVVQKSSGKPGEGFDMLVKELFPSADANTFWRAEQARVWDYWSKH